jgi:DNA replication protein DnaC
MTETATLTTSTCTCDGTGWKIVGARVEPCECRKDRKACEMMKLAAIPERYRDKEFSDYRIDGSNLDLSAGLLMATRFAETYPVLGHDVPGGLLLIGNCGTGKTHLAACILKAVIRKGISGRFQDYAWLLKEIQASYASDGESHKNEAAILSEMTDVDVLVLDDLGSVNPSAWVMDTITRLLNARYSAGKATIITTNFPDRNAGQTRFTFAEGMSLADRVGERVVSRLREMCRFVPMNGPDFRRGIHQMHTVKGGAA